MGHRAAGPVFIDERGPSFAREVPILGERPGVGVGAELRKQEMPREPLRRIEASRARRPGSTEESEDRVEVRLYCATSSMATTGEGVMGITVASLRPTSTFEPRTLARRPPAGAQPPQADAHALLAHVKSPLDSLQALHGASRLHFLQSSGEVQVQMHSP